MAYQIITAATPANLATLVAAALAGDATLKTLGAPFATIDGGFPVVAQALAPAEASGLDVLDDATVANSAAGAAVLLDSGGDIRTASNVGTAASGSAAVEYGDGRVHSTVLTISTALGAIAGGASLGLGKKLYDFPAGEIILESAYMSLALTQTEGHINANTPKVGLGTVVASGAVSVLNGTATFMNIITEQTAANCTGTATVKTAIPTAAVPLVIATAGAHSVYANFAAAWAASGDAGALLTGTVVLNWRFMA